MLLRRRTIILFILLLAVVAVCGFSLRQYLHHPDALWRIVSQQCVPNQRDNHNPAPCAKVDLQSGFVLLKDINGPLQYLLMPTVKMKGMESPDLLQPKTANFFWLAWQERNVMSQRRGTQVPDNAISLTINSTSGRTQNQLHIHISCLREDVRGQLDQYANTLNTEWQAFPVALAGNAYIARKVSAAEFSQRGPFIMLASQVSQARKHMGRYSLAMAKLPGGEWIALATERNLLRLNLASAEQLQDHDCGILK
ncbi:CDP-diacylglycerol pyrophosphatase [Buttiauxella gaviniae ATCC 51604]|uniref:CDP-diacylglycerol pyrophosphatase n=1 Tax=Buttiauxella gaviniae ATCC 51604 TaxID=1354253 RepID=A0A1B7HZB6_9ENTR|nr:CDP-diacylglycerol diphosphatase [Buttiauxella gaviniae]OAT21039.1 CDP-diacylglycerol pyrophosphatase [Buttiauxella gaviniae ATCC 51604]